MDTLLEDNMDQLSSTIDLLDEEIDEETPYPPWSLSAPNDPEARALADRHYSRQNPGSVRFVQAGKCLVLKVPGGRLEWVPTILDYKITALQQYEVAQAVWVTFNPIKEYVFHAWAGAWINQFFRNESDYKSSFLIKMAIKASVYYMGNPPKEGMVTMIDHKCLTPSNTNHVIGYSYRRAGFKHVGKTKGGKEVFHMSPEKLLRIFNG